MAPPMFWFIFLLVKATYALQTVIANSEIERAEREGRVKIFFFEGPQPEPIYRPKKEHTALDIYCYDGGWHSLAKRLPQVWSTANLRLSSSDEDLEVFRGCNESAVYEDYRDTTSRFIRWSLASRTELITFSPFNKTCVGIKTLYSYSAKFKIKPIDPWLICFLIVGVLLFLSAARLSKNVLFYYGTGISVGMLASLLILIYILSRFAPFKKGAYLILLGGWSVVLWGVKYIFDSSLLRTHLHYVLGYLGVAALISFAVCYYKGPVTDPRSLNLIKWSLQLIALVFIYNSSQLLEVAIAISVLLFTPCFFPGFLFRRAGKTWRWYFPKRRKLLSEEEYRQQTNAATREALEELRQYCRSPDCDAWKVISRIGSPQRFAQWVEGSPQFSQDELSTYDNSLTNPPSFTDDDEDEIDFRLNSL